MALATRPKQSTLQKKRQAQHHRHSKHYTKPYFPYLPMLGIAGFGVLIIHSWSGGGASTAVALDKSSVSSSTLLALMTGNSSNTLLYIVLAITFAAFAVFVVTHWYRFHRLLNRGEAFVAKHPWFDIGLAFIVTAGVILTRTGRG